MNNLSSVACCILLSAGGVYASRSAPASTYSPQDSTRFTVHVSLEGQDLWVSSVKARSMQNVREVTSAALAAANPTSDEVVKVIEDSLELAYPGKVSSSVPAQRYKLEFCPDTGQYEVVCCGSNSFLIQMERETVRVEIPVDVTLGE